MTNMFLYSLLKTCKFIEKCQEPQFLPRRIGLGYKGRDETEIVKNLKKEIVKKKAMKIELSNREKNAEIEESESFDRNTFIKRKNKKR